MLASSAPRARLRWWMVALPGFAAAAAALVWWIWLDGKPGARQVEIAVVIKPGAAVVRGPSATLGDTLQATARGDGHCAIWIYLNDQLISTCPGDGRCRMSDGAVEAELLLREIGTFAIVGLCADASLPHPGGHLDADLAAAEKAGAQIKTEPTIVR